MKKFSKTVLALAMVACTANAANMPDNVRVLVDEYSELSPLCRSGHSDAIFTTKDDCKGFPQIRDSLKELGWCFSENTARSANGKSYEYFFYECTDRGNTQVAKAEKRPVMIHVLEWQYMATTYDDWTVFKPKGLYQMGIVTTLSISKYPRQINRVDGDYKKLKGRSYTSVIHTYDIGCSARTAQLIEKSYFDNEGRLIISVKQHGDSNSYLGLEDAARQACGIDS